MSFKPDDNSATGADAIFSNILAECPEFWDVVERFARELPDRIDALTQSMRDGSTEMLMAQLKELESQGAKLGYPQLSMEAAAFEESAANGSLDELGFKLREIRLLADQIRAGISDEGE